MLFLNFENGESLPGILSKLVICPRICHQSTILALKMHLDENSAILETSYLKNLLAIFGKYYLLSQNLKIMWYLLALQ